MTWQLFSPDLPFLNKITVSQHLSGFWDNPLPYVPAIGAVISFLGVCITARLANLARGVANQQKEIAEEKLQLDLFLKRAEAVHKYQEYITEITSATYSNNDEIFRHYNQLSSSHRLCLFLFPHEAKIFDALMNKIRPMKNFRCSHHNIDKMYNNKNTSKEFDDLFNEMSPKLSDALEVFVKYRPAIVEKKSARTIPASRPEPQPTGLKAVRMRLKRAACEWSRPLQ